MGGEDLFRAMSANNGTIDNKVAAEAPKNPDKNRLKNLKSTSQECPNYTPQVPPTKDIGTLHYDCKKCDVKELIIPSLRVFFVQIKSTLFVALSCHHNVENCSNKEQ